MRSRVMFCAVFLAACGGASRAPAPARSIEPDPEGPHRDAIAAAVKPFLDAELVTGLVVGVYSDGKREIYGFGKGPGGGPPDGSSLFEIGSITKIYTGLLLADAIQRREVELDAPVADFLPPGVTVPTAEKTPITLRHLAVHSAGLPRLPPGLANAPPQDPYARYDEDALYRDLSRTQLAQPPGTQILYSNFGAGLLGFALGRKIGGGYEQALAARVLGPLALRDTSFAVPAAAAARRMTGTNDDLAAVPPWTWRALAGAGALISSVRDQLALVEAELDAAAGGKTLPLRNQLRLTQELQLEPRAPENAGLGWMVDGDGRYWHNGGTGGFHAFISFDPKIKHGVVILAATASPLLDRLGRNLYAILAGEPPKAWTAPAPALLTAYAGKYKLAETTLSVVAAGKRLYLEAPGEPRVRLAPVSEHEFWIDILQSVAMFQREGDKVARIVFGVGTRQVIAPRVE